MLIFVYVYILLLLCVQLSLAFYAIHIHQFDVLFATNMSHVPSRPCETSLCRCLHRKHLSTVMSTRRGGMRIRRRERLHSHDYVPGECIMRKRRTFNYEMHTQRRFCNDFDFDYSFEASWLTLRQRRAPRCAYDKSDGRCLSILNE